MAAVAVAPASAGTGLQATAEHCAHAFDALLSHYSGSNCPPPRFPDAFCAIFVTWKKAHTDKDDLRLRGCIGTLEPRNIHTALRDYALTSALKDRRFNPIIDKELQHLHCTVSLIFGFRKAATCMDWEIGTHGLIINFIDRRENVRRSSTFLPEVASQEGWTKQQTLDSLVRKSGYTGQPTQELYSEIELTTYLSSPCSMSYKEYARLNGHA